MLLFRSEEHLSRWIQLRGTPLGATLTPQQCWQLAHAWYRSRLSSTWRRPSPQEAQKVLESLGLTDPFWRLA